MVAKSLIFGVLLSSMLAGCMANRNWGFGFNYTDWLQRHRSWYGQHHPNQTQQVPSKIIVGGSEHWRFNFSYIDWAFKHGPFHLNDILVFKYNPLKGKDSHPHSVYQLPDLRSFVKCDLSKGKKLANATRGAGEGFEVVLDKWQPYYFTCGESNGFHCDIGRMKFFVIPMLRPWRM